MEIRKHRNDYFRNRANKTRVNRTFEADDIVFIKDFSIAEIEGGSLKSPWIGPMAVLSADPERLICEVTPLSGSGRNRRVHFNHCKHVKSTLHPHPSLTVNKALKILKNDPKVASKMDQSLPPIHTDDRRTYDLRPRKSTN